jgi:hypothetical protein
VSATVALGRGSRPFPAARFQPACGERPSESAAGSHSFTDTSKYENRRPLLRSEGHVALVYKTDHASGIERIGVENLLILFATRAAGRLIARRGDDPNRSSVAAAGTGWTSGAGRASGTRRASRARRPGTLAGFGSTGHS